MPSTDPSKRALANDELTAMAREVVGPSAVVIHHETIPFGDGRRAAQGGARA